MLMTIITIVIIKVFADLGCDEHDTVLYISYRLKISANDVLESIVYNSCLLESLEFHHN